MRELQPDDYYRTLQEDNTDCRVEILLAEHNFVGSEHNSKMNDGQSIVYSLVNVRNTVTIEVYVVYLVVNVQLIIQVYEQ